MKKFHDPFFDTPEAHGHNHFLACFYVDEKGWWKQITMTNEEPTKEKESIYMFQGPKDKSVVMPLAEAVDYYNYYRSRIHMSPYQIGCFDSIWMMHVAINLYNEDGLFADTFPLIDTITTTSEIYSFFGKKFDLNDYAFWK